MQSLATKVGSKTLSVKDLSMAYNNKGKKSEKEYALNNVNLSVEPGEFIGILGRSGAGKSTFIRCINMLVRPTSGHVYWSDVDMTQLSRDDLCLTRREMGMIFQQFCLVPRISVLKNCVMGCFGYRPVWKNVLGLITAEERERAMDALKRVGIDHMAEKRVDELSGGQQQRVAIARVIMQQPMLLLGDEPVSSLDPITTKQIMDLIREVHATGQMTAIMNLHNVNLALEYCDRIIGLSNGNLVFDGKPADVNQDILDMIYH